MCNTYTFQNPTYVKMYITKDFLDGAEDKKLPAKAGGHGFNPGPGNSTRYGATQLHALQLWGPPSRAPEPAVSEASAQSPRPAAREAGPQ